jgi:hypothetical protein
MPNEESSNVQQNPGLELNGGQANEDDNLSFLDQG